MLRQRRPRVTGRGSFENRAKEQVQHEGGAASSIDERGRGGFRVHQLESLGCHSLGDSGPRSHSKSNAWAGRGHETFLPEPLCVVSSSFSYCQHVDN